MDESTSSYLSIQGNLTPRSYRAALLEQLAASMPAPPAVAPARSYKDLIHSHRKEARPIASQRMQSYDSEEEEEEEDSVERDYQHEKMLRLQREWQEQQPQQPLTHSTAAAPASRGKMEVVNTVLEDAHRDLYLHPRARQHDEDAVGVYEEPHSPTSYPRSLILDYIDDCLVHNVPEETIARQVEFMTAAMEEICALHGSLHAQQQRDKIRLYEISQLANCVERQGMLRQQGSTPQRSPPSPPPGAKETGHRPDLRGGGGGNSGGGGMSMHVAPDRQDAHYHYEQESNARREDVYGKESTYPRDERHWVTRHEQQQQQQQQQQRQQQTSRALWQERSARTPLQEGSSPYQYKAAPTSNLHDGRGDAKLFSSSSSTKQEANANYHDKDTLRMESRIVVLPQGHAANGEQHLNYNVTTTTSSRYDEDYSDVRRPLEYRGPDEGQHTITHYKNNKRNNESRDSRWRHDALVVAEHEPEMQYLAERRPSSSSSSFHNRYAPSSAITANSGNPKQLEASKIKSDSGFVYATRRSATDAADSSASIKKITSVLSEEDDSRGALVRREQRSSQSSHTRPHKDGKNAEEDSNKDSTLHYMLPTQASLQWQKVPRSSSVTTTDNDDVDVNAHADGRNAKAQREGRRSGSSANGAAVVRRPSSGLKPVRPTHSSLLKEATTRASLSFNTEAVHNNSNNNNNNNKPYISMLSTDRSMSQHNTVASSMYPPAQQGQSSHHPQHPHSHHKHMSGMDASGRGHKSNNRSQNQGCASEYMPFSMDRRSGNVVTEVHLSPSRLSGEHSKLSGTNYQVSPTTSSESEESASTTASVHNNNRSHKSHTDSKSHTKYQGDNQSYSSEDRDSNRGEIQQGPPGGDASAPPSTHAKGLRHVWGQSSRPPHDLRGNRISTPVTEHCTNRRSSVDGISPPRAAPPTPDSPPVSSSSSSLGAHAATQRGEAVKTQPPTQATISTATANTHNNSNSNNNNNNNTSSNERWHSTDSSGALFVTPPAVQLTSPELQLFLELSQRKVKESERVLSRVSSPAQSARSTSGGQAAVSAIRGSHSRDGASISTYDGREMHHVPPTPQQERQYRSLYNSYLQFITPQHGEAAPSRQSESPVATSAPMRSDSEK